MNRSLIHNFTYHTIFEAKIASYLNKKYNIDRAIGVGYYFHRIICGILYYNTRSVNTNKLLRA